MLQDDTLALHKHTIQAGWPEKIQQMPPEIQPYWTFPDELTIEDGLVLKIPKLSYSPQKEMISQSKSAMDILALSNVSYMPKKQSSGQA